jgi:hypothetical protein
MVRKCALVGKSFSLVGVSIIVLLITTAFVSSGVVYSTTTTISIPVTNEIVPTRVLQAKSAPSYIIAGGQEGAWFAQDQYPELYKISPGSIGSRQEIPNFFAASLATISGEGTVWSGGFNGSNWLVTGWGSGKYLNPYISLYNQTTTSKTRLGNYPEIESAEQEWSGGDVFAVGWNGTDWLLTGMGSGELLPGEETTNHMSMAVLSANGTFTDLSLQIPNQGDLILYANAWNGNGNYWLVGGGWYGTDQGQLYVLSGDTITDITNQIASVVPTFNSIQSIAWNGQYFLIGGVGFLAEYNGSTFTDLTTQLNQALDPSHMFNDTTDNAVNTIAWMGTHWMLAGGTPIADYHGVPSQGAWVASLVQGSEGATGSVSIFTDLTSVVIPSYILKNENASTILAMSCSVLSGCAIGGSDSSGGVLLWYDGVSSIDLSSTVNSNMSYVQWVDLSST